MKFSAMRRLDSLLGLPMCLFLGAVERVLRLFGRPGAVPPLGSARGILVMKFLGVGSVVEASPMFRLLRQGNPKADIRFLTFDSCAETARLLGCFDGVRAIRTSSWRSFLVDTLTAIVWGWRRRFDVSYDLEFFSKYSYVMSYLIHARARVGYFVRVLRYVNLLTHCVPFNPHRHVSEAFVAQLDLGAGSLQAPDLVPPLLPPEAEREATKLLREADINEGEPFILVNANTSSLSSLRLWPAEHYARLVDLMAETVPMPVIFIGGPQDAPRTADVLSRVRPDLNVRDFTGRTSLPGLLALLRRARLLISSDSGPLHLGALMGTPTVSFFGAESARVYGPRGSLHRNLDRELYCSPCLNVYNFKDYDCPYSARCLMQISPEEALAAARDLVGKAGGP